MSKLIDLTGQRFGRLAVVSRAENSPSKKVRWLCSCVCGEVKVVEGRSLLNGSTQSCGCLHREIAKKQCKENNKRLIKHGDIRSRLYNIWHGMKQRTENKNHQFYHHYGGRGIYLCKAWAKDYTIFMKWALENGYRIDLTIDRIDNNKGYYPQNCRWTDRKTQANNTRVNNNIFYNDKTQTLSQWAEELKIERSVLKYRLKHGYSVEEAFSTPVKKR